MQPSRAGRTRTAPPSLPDRFPFGGRYLVYTLFDLTGLLYLVVGFVVLRAVWALGNGPEAWQTLREQFTSPFYVAFHLLTLVAVCFVAVRFFRLFPKAQPPRIGPVKPPPGPLIHAMLYVVWLGVTLVFATILAGGLF
jgi:fumarate reductase subunit C